MIEINLLPDELRVRKQNNPGDLNYLIYLIPLFIAIVVIIHLYFGLVYLTRTIFLSSLNNKWKVLEPQRNTLTNLKNESALQSSESKILKQVNDKLIKLAFKINKLSLELPSGVWFNDFTYDGKSLTLKASVVSLKDEHLELINKFLDNLKNDKVFIGDFNSLDLGPLQRKVVGSFDVVDFLIIGDIKK